MNHNGNIKLAKKLIDAAKEAGADAVKFQTFQTDKLVSFNAKKAQYQIENTGSSESQYEMIKALELSYAEFNELKNYSDKTGIIFLSTPFDHESVDFLDRLGISLFKIPSGEITNIPLLEQIGKKEKPVILSTGMSTLGEVEEAIEALISNGATKITLLHCTTSYPAPVESVNLSAMKTLRCAFKFPVGYSDHTEGITIPIAAAALGATVIEKHFTLDKTLPGPDHKSSLEPDELREMIKAIRNTELSIGDGIKKPEEAEIKNMTVARKSIVAKRDIKAGEILTKENISLKRPGDGIQPKYFNTIIGTSVKKDIKKDSTLKWSDMEKQ